MLPPQLSQPHPNCQAPAPPTSTSQPQVCPEANAIQKPFLWVAQLMLALVAVTLSLAHLSQAAMSTNLAELLQYGGPLLREEPELRYIPPLSTFGIEGTIISLQTCVPGTAMRPTS